MDILVFVLVVLLGGLIVGALARLAVPGPDPMSIWRTIALGILGSLLGSLIAALVGMGNGGGLLFALVGAVLLLILYRRVVQKRGITGPSARRL
ncbi:MAG TPA: GlsB/YeaQ/YmgE family stress response membrane protein [Gaiellaceae bacterium]|nr:GlsB/YeaQ/YmgE family stress response membrane protein [Gaiellaceae bacterium]